MTKVSEDVTIARLGAQGDGVADTPDGLLYVPLALPGESVRVTRGDASDRAKLATVLTPSAERSEPICLHFGTCGGCVAQHMSAALYREWKRQAVAQAFAHRGLQPRIADVLAVGPGTRRRAVLEAVAQAGVVRLGFHAAASHDVIDLEECPVLMPAVAAALPTLREIAAAMIAPDNSVRMTVLAAEPGLDVALEAKGLAVEAVERARVAQLAARGSITRLTLNGEIVHQSAPPELAIGDVRVRVPPAVFVQASGEAEARMIALVLEGVGKAKRVADLFAGIGTFTYPLARKASVLAIDSDSAAVAALKEAASRAQGLKKIETRVRDLMREPMSRKELEGFDTVVLDPPRAGAKAQCEMLARAKVPVVVMVSCNPATLARDIRILADAGYRFETVTPIDQFVFSQHIEALAVLRR